MSYVSLYRRFRPTSFSQVIGQDHIVRTLTNQIAAGRISHAYLFTGTRGTGKTTIAKIFGKAVNCENPQNGSPCGKCDICTSMGRADSLDVIEIDAASNNGVDEIRELNDSVKFKPSIGRYKVYIIDEVHMLTPSAFNAFLKTLEEPPEHVIFCLATTEVQKLPATILSRCMRFDFRLVAKEKIAALVTDIYKQVGFACDARGIDLIAAHGEGSVRDALSIADMALSYGGEGITYEELLFLLGSTEKSVLHAFAEAILASNTSKVLHLANDCAKKGISPNNLQKDLAEYLSNLMRVKNITSFDVGGYLSPEEEGKMKTLGGTADNYRIGRAMDIMGKLEGALRYSMQPQILLEAALIEASELGASNDSAAYASRLGALEKQLQALKEQDCKPNIKVQALAPKVEQADTQNKAHGQQIDEINVEQKDKKQDSPLQAAVPVQHNTVAQEAVSEEQGEAIFGQSACVDNDAADLFADNDKATSELNRAKELLATLVVGLAEVDPLGLVRMALADEDDVIIKDKTLALRTARRANFNLLNESKSISIINSVLAKHGGFEFVCEYTEQSGIEGREELMGELRQLFPNELIVEEGKRK